jgi:hypothetical protein
MKLRVPIRRDTLREDSVAGLVLGVQSVPDGLASGLLAGVNPLAGLYAYMVGTITGASVSTWARNRAASGLVANVCGATCGTPARSRYRACQRPEGSCRTEPKDRRPLRRAISAHHPTSRGSTS